MTMKAQIKKIHVKPNAKMSVGQSGDETSLNKVQISGNSAMTEVKVLLPDSIFLSNFKICTSIASFDVLRLYLAVSPGMSTDRA